MSTSISVNPAARPRLWASGLGIIGSNRHVSIISHRQFLTNSLVRYGETKRSVRRLHKPVRLEIQGSIRAQHDGIRGEWYRPPDVGVCGTRRQILNLISIIGTGEHDLIWIAIHQCLVTGGVNGPGNTRYSAVDPIIAESSLDRRDGHDRQNSADSQNYKQLSQGETTCVAWEVPPRTFAFTVPDCSHHFEILFCLFPTASPYACLP